MIDTLTEKSSFNELFTYAQSPKTPKEELVRLALSEDWLIRVAVAENPNAPKELLVKLASDPWEDVRLAIAANPNTPTEVLVKLAEDGDTHVKKIRN